MLYSADMLRHLQQLRPRIYSEFGVRIRLADPDLLDQLSVLWRRSRDPFARKCMAQVLSQAGRTLPEMDSKPPALNTPVTYRGVTVAPQSAAERPHSSRGSHKRVYRGRPVLE